MNKGSVKVKGIFASESLSKNPQNLICNDAVMNFLISGKAIEETILECKDIRRFVTVRRVKGGAVKDGIYLGRVVRWYYAKGEYGTINYKMTGNKVPESEGGKPLMELNGFPFDIDYFWYIRKAKSMLEEIAFYGSKKTTQLKLF